MADVINVRITFEQSRTRLNKMDKKRHHLLLKADC